MRFVQLITAFFAFLLALLFLFQGYLALFLVFLLLSVVLIFQYFRFGPAFYALGHVRRGNFIAAERVLKSIKNVQKLSPEKRAYFYLVRALIDERQNSLSSAETNFNKALYEGMLSEQADGMARFGLAKIYQLQGRNDKANHHFRKIDRSKMPRSLQNQMNEFEGSIEFESQNDRNAVSLFPSDD